MKADDPVTWNQETLKRVILETIRDNPNEFGKAFKADHIEANTTLKVGGQSLAGFVTGQVDGSGNIVAGSGFSVTRNAAGDYTFTFIPPFPAIPTILLVPADSTGVRIGRVSSTAPPTPDAARVLFTTTGNVGTDTIFNFVAFTTN